jgi:hypothetical protein
VKDQQDVLGKLPSLSRQRQEILSHPERLDTLSEQHTTSANMVLLPGSRTRINTEIIPYISAPCAQSTGPPVRATNPVHAHLEYGGDVHQKMG